MNCNQAKCLLFLTNHLIFITTLYYEIPSVEDVRFFVSHVDYHLNWSVHIQNLNKRLSSAVYVLHILRDVVDIKNFKDRIFWLLS